MTRLDQTLRWVWLVNGVLLLLLLTAGGVALAVAGLSTLGGSAAGVPTKAPEARPERAAPLRYGPPETVRGTAVRIVVIRRGTGYVYRNRLSSGGGAEAPAVNVAFLEGARARLLLDRPAYIARVRFPGDGEAMGDTLRWIVYEAALEDSNHDGVLDDRDRRSLYVTGLDGRGLRSVLPAGFELRDWRGEPDGSLVVTAVQLQQGGAEMPERAFVVEPSGSVRPYAALDSAVAAAGRIVGNP